MGAKGSSMKLLAGSNTVKGTINDGMDVEFALKLGKFIGKTYGSPVAVSMDGRTSNVMLKSALTAGIMSVGCDVYDLGAVPSPLLQFYMGQHPEVCGGVTITASFAGQDMNGFKIMKSGGADDSIFYNHSVESILSEEIDGVPGLQVGEVFPVEDIVEGYINSILSEIDVGSICKKRLKICLDCRNEAIIPIASALLRSLCVDMITIGGDTSALDIDRLVKLGHMVKSQGFDLGVAIEMDDDHCLFAADNGKAIQGDKSFSLFAKSILSEGKGKVVLPINSSTLMENVIKDSGGLPLYCTVGEYTVIRKVKENDAAMGGDMFGCMVFPDGDCRCDALITMVKMLEIVAKNGPISKQVKQFPDYFISRGSFEIPDGRIKDVLDKFKKLYDGHEMDLVDGVKVVTDEGWILVRHSNVKGVVKVYSQANSREEADEAVRKTIEQLNV